MNDLELNSLADGLLLYLRRETQTPMDAISVLGIAIVKLYDQNSDHSLDFPAFAENFRKGLIDTWKDKSSVGPGGLQ